MELSQNNGLSVFCRQVADKMQTNIKVSFDPFSILMTLIPIFLSCINDNDNTDPSEVAEWVRMKERSDRHRLLKRFTKNAIAKSKKQHRKDASVHVLSEDEAYNLAVTTVDTALQWEQNELNVAATSCMLSM
jgi:hypothetical protein